MKLRGNLALVTGASGFVGGHVARRLADAEGMQVRALVRNLGGKTVVDLSHPSIESVKGDLLDPESLSTASVGAQLVVHAAADTTMQNRAIAWATSVDGTCNLFNAAHIVGVQRFIFVSTFDVYLGVLDRFRDEETPLSPYGDVYGDAKIVAEELLLANADKGPVVIILRPPAIYGPGSREWTVRIIEHAKKGRLYLPGGGEFPFPYIYIDNLVDAVLAAARADTSSGVYNVLDGRVTYREFVEPLAQLVECPPRSLPYWILWIGGVGAEVFSRLTGRWLPLSLKRVRAMNTRNRRRYATADKARRDLDWVTRVDFQEGMQRTQTWLYKVGYLERRNR